MKGHQRDALVTACIGILCGAVIGSGYMGFLKPLATTITSNEHAADWFSGTGTWVVGIAAAILTVQQHRATTQRAKAESQRQQFEQKAARDRQMAEQKDREDKDAKEWLAAFVDYRASLARLSMPSHLISSVPSRISHLDFRQAIDLIRDVKASFPPLPLPHGKYLQEDRHLPDIAALEAIANRSIALCDEIIGSLSDDRYTSVFPFLVSHDQTELMKLVHAVTTLGTKADELGLEVDKIRAEMD